MKLKLRLEIILPFFCTLVWAFVAVFKDNFYIDPIDYHIYYEAGKDIFTDPSRVYTRGFYYLPVSAMLFFPLSFFSLTVSTYLYFLILIIFGLLLLVEFRKILILNEISDARLQLLILLLISNGYAWMFQFDLLNIKIVIAYLIVLVIRRELSMRKGEIEEDLKFKILQVNLFLLFIALVPPLIPICIIYLLKDVDFGNFKEIIGKSKLKDYGLFVSFFLIQNIMFLIFPSLISGFLDGMSVFDKPELTLNLSYSEIIQNRIMSPVSPLLLIACFLNLGNSSILSLVSIIIVFVVTIAISLIKNERIEYQIALCFLSYLFFNIFLKKTNYIHIVPIIMLLFIEDESFPKSFPELSVSALFNFLKDNINFIIGLLCLSLLIILPPIFVIVRIISILQLIPYQIFFFFWMMLYIIAIVNLILIYYSQND